MFKKCLSMGLLTFVGGFFYWIGVQSGSKFIEKLNDLADKIDEKRNK